MSWGGSERTACRTTGNGTGDTGTVTLGGAVSAGDAVVIAVAAQGSGDVAASGLGATWVTLRNAQNPPTSTLLIGYNCSAGGTSVSLSGIGAGNVFSYVATAFSGLRTDSKIIGTAAQGTATTGTSTTTAPDSDVKGGRLVVAAAAHSSGTTSNGVNAATWSTAETNTSVGVSTCGTSGSFRVAHLDFMTSSAAEATHASYTSAVSGVWDVLAVELVEAGATPSSTARIVQSFAFASGSAGTTTVVTLPAPPQAGHYLVAFIGTETTTTWSATGWTQRDSTDQTSGNARLVTLERVADGTEGKSITFTGSASHNRTIVVYEVDGWSGSTTDIQFATNLIAAVAAGGTAASPAVVAATNSLPLALFTANSFGAGDTLSSPWTKDYFANSGAHDMDTGHRSIVAPGTSTSVTQTAGTTWGADGIGATMLVPSAPTGGTSAGVGTATGTVSLPRFLAGTAHGIATARGIFADSTLSATGTRTRGGSVALELTEPLTATGTRTRSGSVSMGVITGLAPPAGTPGQGWEWNGRTRTGAALLDIDPPVAPVPPNRKRVVLATLTNDYPDPVLIDGRPYADADGNPWEPTDGPGTHGEWGTYRIVIHGYDRTWVRDEQTLIIDYADEDPGGPTTMTIAFPAITSWDELDTGDLAGIKPGAGMLIHKHLPDGSAGGPIWGGELGVETDTLEDSGTGAPASYLTFNCRGWWMTLDDFITTPRLNPDPVEAADFIERLCWRAHVFGWPAYVANLSTLGITGLLISERGEYGAPLGSQTVTNALKLMQRRDGTVYTLKWDYRYRLEVTERNWGGDPDFSFRVGIRGLSHTLTRDPTQAFTAIFGRGQHDDQAWENWQYPTAYVDPPNYPLPVGVACCTNLFCPGCSSTGFQVFSDELRSHGWNLDSQDTYSASDADLIADYQDAIGVQVDGVVGPQTWIQTFQLGQNADVLGDAYIRELWSRPEVQPFLRNARGGNVGDNPDFDRTVVRRIEKLVDYGVLDKATARQSAHLEGSRNWLPYYVGTITARNIDPHEMSSLDTYSGMNMLLRGHRGEDRTLHVVKRNVQPGMTIGGGAADRVVTWTVSERPDDMMTLAQMLARKQGVRDLVANNRPQRRSSHRTPDWVPFDSESGAGIQTREAQFEGLWNVYQVPLGEALDVAAVKLVADRPCLIAAAIFNQRITPAHLQHLPGLSNPAIATTDPWQTNTRTLEALGIQWATGSGSSGMQGYWPNVPGGLVTGVLADTAPWPFRTLRPPYGYLAVWTSESCKIGGDPAANYRAVYPAPEH